jgi:hypothetical protein
VAEYRYPYRKLEKTDDYLHIKVVDYKAPGIPTLGQTTSSSSSNQVTVNHNIYLPMPQGIEDSNSVDWGDDTLNPIAATALGLSKDAIESDNPFKGIQSGIQKAIGITNDQILGGNAQHLISTGFAAAAVGALGANVNLESLISRSSGQVLNPNMELLFKGVKLRSFQFTYDLVARDSTESSYIKGMIRTLKTSMAPRKSSSASTASQGLFISAPNVFQLEFRKGSSKHPFLPTFKPMALIGMGVNYTGSGTYATYSDGAPIHLNMTLSFQELNPVYYEDYNDSNAQIGVGY